MRQTTLKDFPQFKRHIERLSQIAEKNMLSRRAYNESRRKDQVITSKMVSKKKM